VAAPSWWPLSVPAGVVGEAAAEDAAPAVDALLVFLRVVERRLLERMRKSSARSNMVLLVLPALRRLRFMVSSPLWRQ